MEQRYGEIGGGAAPARPLRARRRAALGGLALLLLVALLGVGALALNGAAAHRSSGTRQASAGPTTATPATQATYPTGAQSAATRPTPAATVSPTATPTAGASRQAPPPTAQPTQPTQPATGADKTSNGCAITSAQVGAEQWLLATLNAHRSAAGSPPLTLDPTLTRIAREHSCDMYQMQKLQHNGSDGSTPFQRMSAAGVSYRSAGENIGTTTGYPLADGVKTIDDGMMAEPLTEGDHHWNIVNAGYTRVGLGVIAINNQVWLTEDFTG